MGDNNDLKALKEKLKDFDLIGADFDAKTVWVPPIPENRNDEEAMKEWKCKGNIAIFLHMHLLKNNGLSKITFDVRERGKETRTCKLSSKSENVKKIMCDRGKRKHFDEEGVTYALREHRQNCALSSNSTRFWKESDEELEKIIKSRPKGVISQKSEKIKFKRQIGATSSSSRSNEELLDHVEVEVPNRNEVISAEFKEKIIQLGGSEDSIQFVIRKGLTQSDMDVHQARLSIPLGQIKNPFLTYQEMIKVMSHNVKAIFIEPNPNFQCTLNVRKWMSSKSYQLVSPWNEVVKRNNLEEHMVMEVWTFRIGSQLGLTLIPVK